MVSDLVKFIYMWGGNIIIHNLYAIISVIVIHQKVMETQWDKGNSQRKGSFFFVQMCHLPAKLTQRGGSSF